jgi:lipoate-protein ligase A
MALDEALLDACVASPEGFPVLRLYAFQPACLSIGFSQEFARAVDAGWCRSNGIDVVRRPTGGRAVLHDAEVTYSVVARRDAPPFDGDLLAVYEAVSGGLLAAFRLLGLDAAISKEAPSAGSPGGGAVCFAEPSRHEISAGGLKIAGSSQMRRRRAFLQHGSIPISLDAGRLAAATGTAPLPLPKGSSDPARAHGLGALIGRALSPAGLRAAIRSGFEEAFGVRLAPGRATPSERERAEWLRAHRYLTEAWTLRR